MRTTVGSLPPGVYWRRRAVVLGVLLLVVIVLFVSCSGGGGGNKNTGQRGQGTSTGAAVPPSTTPSPEDTPSFSDANPGGGPSLPAPNDIDSNQPSLGDGTGDGGPGLPASQAAGGTNQNAAAPTGDTCADSEMSVIPVPGSTTVKRGVPVNIKLIIKNVGNRTCSRDVGAGPQELYIDQGARKYWSSDSCSDANGSNVIKFSPGAERQYNATWNGRQSSKCTGGSSDGPAPPAGVFQIYGRLGTKVSNPVTMTISA